MKTMSQLSVNAIVGIFWLLVMFLTISTHTSQMFLAMMFTVVVLHLSENFAESVSKNKMIKKSLAVFLSGLILTAVSLALYHSFQMMGQDIGRLVSDSQPLIEKTLKDLGVEKNIQTVTDLYAIVMDFLKANIGLITFSASLLLKVIIGIILGVIVHFGNAEGTGKIENAWDAVIQKVVRQCKTLYKSFRDVMSVQILVSVMNTTIISVFALGLTKAIYDQFLPYWYIVIPFTAILSLIPVVGNIMINMILILATIQLSPVYVLVGVGLFLVIHKLELIVIGNKMNEKVNIPFIIILFSMVIGEMLFHSMSGMMLGMVIMVALSHILREMRAFEQKME